MLFITVALLAFTVRLAAAEQVADSTLSTMTGEDGEPTELEEAKPAEADATDGLAGSPSELAATELAEASPTEGLAGSPSELADAAAFDLDWSDADAADARAEQREREPTRIGRIDLAITWRRTLREVDTRTVDGIASRIDPVTTARGVLWVMLTWSR